MAGYWSNARVYTVETYGFPAGLSYVDLMTAAGVYTPYTEMTEENLTKEQKYINSYIQSKDFFNAVVYGIKWTNGIPDNINDKNYDILRVNDYRMKMQITPKNSVGIYGTDVLSIDLDPNILYLNYADAHGGVLPEEGTEERDELDQQIIDRELKAGDYVYIYAAVEWNPPANIPSSDEGDESEDDDDNIDEMNSEFIPIIIKLIMIEEDEDDPDMEEKEDPNQEIPVDFDINPEDMEDDVEISYVVTDKDGNELPIKYLRYIFMNTVSLFDISTRQGGILYAKTWFLQTYFSPLCPVEYNFTVTQLGVNNGKNSTFSFHYKPQQVNITGNEYNRTIKMNNPDVSYALLRTNPKLTGNVKVVVDSSSNIYLDTFKISDTLSRRRYRHIKVGANTYYGSSLMLHFKDMPTTDFYKIQDKCYNMFTPAQTYKDQYYDEYRYGAFTNDDNMYPENFSILAPLCVKRILPDFFLVFKVDKNTGDYDEVNMSDKEKIQYFIQHGKLIKSYDMRDGSPLGKYVRNIYEMSKGSAGYVYEAYDRNNYNKFTGISLDRGVVTDMYESFCDQEKINNQVYLNDFLTKGFERNHVVSKDIVNFQFMFDDPDASLFSINTYYGLYVKVNTQDSNFACIGRTGDPENDEGTTYTYDQDIYTFDIKNISKNSDFKTLIYGITTPDSFIRINEGLKYAKENEQFIKRPYKNIFSSPVTKIKTSEVPSYITVQMNNTMDAGDHIRFISQKHDTIYEIIFSGDNVDDESPDRIQGTYPDELGVTDVITNTYRLYGHKYEFKRVGVHVRRRDDIEESEVESEIKKQIEQIYHAIGKFDNKMIMPWGKSDRGYSVKAFDTGFIFERICAASGFTSKQRSYLEKTDDEDKTLMFFGHVYPEKLLLDVNQTVWESTSLAYLYPLHFEVVGNRMAHVMAFVDTTTIGDGEYIYACDNAPAAFTDIKTVLYYGTGADGNETCVKDDITVWYYANEDNHIIMKPVVLPQIQAFTDPGKSFINVKHPLTTKGTISFYNPYPINVGICSILQMKDFDFNVLDSSSLLLTNSSSSRGSISCNQEYDKISIFNTTPGKRKEASEKGKETTDNTDGGVKKGVEKFYGTVAEFRSWMVNNINEAYNDNQNMYRLEQLCGTNYIILPVLSSESGVKTKIVDSEHEDYNTVMTYTGEYDSFDSYYPGDWEASTAETDMDVDIFDSSDTDVTFDTGYSATPARTTNEEDFRNYIDEYNIHPLDTQWTGDFLENKEKRNDFLRNMFETNHSRMDISLVSPYCCKWKSIGSDARGETMKIMYDYDSLTNHDMPSYYVPYGSPDGTVKAYDTYLGYMYLANKNATGYAGWKKYIPKSPEDIVEISEIDDYNMKGRKYMKTYILQNRGTIDDLLYDGKDPSNKFTRTYISGDNTLEFISAGVKIRIRSNNSNIVNLNKYNGYSAVFVTFPFRNLDYGKSTEIIIDELRQEIMFAWYKPANTFQLGYKVATKNVDENYLKADSSAGYRIVLPMKEGIQNITSFAFDDLDGNAWRSTYISDIGDYATREEKYDKLIDDSIAHYGKRLCKRMAYIYVPYINIDDDMYSKYRTMAFCGVIYDSRPITPDINTTFPYYTNDGLTPVIPTIWYNMRNEYLSNADIEEYSAGIGQHFDAYVLTDSLEYVDSYIASYTDLKNDLESYSVFIKTDGGKKDYTDIPDLLTIEVVDPVAIQGKDTTYYAHPTYAEPVMKDIFNFNYNSYNMSVSNKTSNINKGYFEDDEERDTSNSIEGIFHKSFDGANISIDSVNTIDQIWINKYTTDNNYCQQQGDDGSVSYNLSLDGMYNVSVMDDSWMHNTYRKYYMNEGEERYSIKKGYTTGYELRSFFNSKGICLKDAATNNTLSVTTWKNAEISYEKGYIKLNITDSIVYGILTNSAFIDAWKKLDQATNDHKIKYIRNTILHFININNKTKFILRKNKASEAGTSITADRINFMPDYTEDGSMEITNYKNELRYEKGMYYMYVYPEEGGTFYAKMIIDL